MAEATKVPSELLHITVEGRTLTDEVVCGIGAGATLHCSVKGLGGADSKTHGWYNNDLQQNLFSAW